MERNTRQRTCVLNEVRGRSDHPTAHEIYAAVRKKLPNISLTTVYRNLTDLADDGLILRIAVPGSSERFDRTVKIHFHMLCDNCHGFSDISDDGHFFDIIRESVEKSDGFFVSGMDVVLRGTCADCIRKENDKDKDKDKAKI